MNANLKAVDAAKLSERLAEASPTEIVAEAVRSVGKTRLAVASSFGIESATLLKIVADVDPSIPVLFLDTGWLFPETLTYRDVLIERLGLTDVRTIAPLADKLTQKDPLRGLYATDPDACCFLRKVEPLSDALAGFDGWINGRKRYQGGLRTGINAVEVEGPRLKFNPLARVTPTEVMAMFKAFDLPAHPLAGQSFASVGCVPCTRRVNPGDNARDGRWADSEKTECGIHNRMPLVDGAGI